MRRAALLVTALAAASSAFAAGEDVYGGARVNDSVVNLGEASAFNVFFRGDLWCGKTIAEVPNPPKPVSTGLRDAASYLPGIVKNAMLIAVLQVDADGDVTKVDVEGGWPGSNDFRPAFRKAAVNMDFEPGKPGQYCAAFFIDVDGQVQDLYRTPKNLAPKPSVATAIPYPEYAYEQNVEGVSVLSIDVGADGKVIDARIVTESPLGYGFGRSAVETVMSEWRFDGAQAGRYRLKLKFAR